MCYSDANVLLPLFFHHAGRFGQWVSAGCVLTARLRGGNGGWPDFLAIISDGQEHCYERASTLALEASTWMSYNQGFFTIFTLVAFPLAKSAAAPTTCLRYSSGRREFWETYPVLQKNESRPRKSETK